ncbi:winged helix-turn-helix transcriptional regulator [Microbacterium allomyrinae]|jgi:DNA-binding HxlR family transcriptional regulator|uniref:Helix-turn-helix transcriptional regulator n=1 Tax=Microbacterium allomyrinae TaxID=2830666 RepID=A0A9X1S332_9MICO|nr:helix-turn-helix domain-containing protein [Microbacterium allomyrinae]MCC2033326.1 helix-turn-helix transcriptional regulator [Microbacterium allomyrinae]
MTSSAAPITTYEDSCAAVGDGRAVREVLDRVGDKWTLLVVATLRNGRLRFSELQRHIPGISQRMLTLTVRQLERDGLVSRTVHAEVPPRVEYELTELGGTLLQLSIALGDWAIANQPRIEQARQVYDAAAAAKAG